MRWISICKDYTRKREEREILGGVRGLRFMVRGRETNDVWGT